MSARPRAPRGGVPLTAPPHLTGKAAADAADTGGPGAGMLSPPLPPMPPVIVRGRSGTEPRVEAAPPPLLHRRPPTPPPQPSPTADSPSPPSPSTAALLVAGGGGPLMAPAPEVTRGLSRGRTGSPSGGGDAASRPPSPVPPPPLPPPPTEGSLWVLTRTALIFTRWRRRFAVVSPADARLGVWADAPAARRGEPPLTAVALGDAALALTPMRTAPSPGAGAGAPDEGPTLFHRDLVRLGSHWAAAHLPARGWVLHDADARAAAAAGGSPQVVLTFGAASLPALEAWSAALRGALAAAHAAHFAGGGAAGADGGRGSLTGAPPPNSADLFAGALEAAHAAVAAAGEGRRRRPRGSTHGGGGEGVAHDVPQPHQRPPPLPSAAAAPWPTITLPVSLLDDATVPLRLALPAGGSVRDAALAARRALRLTADADYAVCLRDAPAPGAAGGAGCCWGRDALVALPDVLPLEEAARLALAPGRGLVYARRMRTAVVGVGVGAGGSGAGAPPLPDAAGSHPAGGALPSEPGEGRGGGAVNFDAEAARAASPADGALRLAFAEAAYRTRAGDYLFPLGDALVMGALLLLGRAAAAHLPPPVAEGAVGAGADAAAGWVDDARPPDAAPQRDAAPPQSAPKRRKSGGSDGGRQVHTANATATWEAPPSPTAPAAAAPPRPPLADSPQEPLFYERALPWVVAAQSVAEHKRTTGGSYGELARALGAEHARLCRLFTPPQAQRLVVARAAALPEHGAAFFAATLRRAPAVAADGERGGGGGGRPHSPPPPSEDGGGGGAPTWAPSDLTASLGPGIPVLVAISVGAGVLLRPLPPQYHHAAPAAPAAAPAPLPPRYRTALDEPNRALHPLGGLSPAERLAADGRPPGWHAHRLASITAWGTADLPGGAGQALVLTAREARGAVRVELRGAAAREMSAALHGAVLAQLAAREGVARPVARPSGGGDAAALADAVRSSVADARAAAAEALRLCGGDPSGLVMLQDPLTGETAWWHPDLRRPVFSRRV